MTRICKVCKQELPATSEYFYTHKSYKLGLRLICKTCQRTQCKDYRKNNVDKIRAYKKKYYQGKQHNSNEYTVRYRRDNAEKFQRYAQKHEARKRMLPMDYTAKQWEETKTYFNNKCAYCGEEKILTQEHVVPLSKGGEYTVNNIIPACGNCNSSKKNQDFFKWYQRYKHYSKRREQKILKYLNYKNNMQQLAITI